MGVYHALDVYAFLLGLVSQNWLVCKQTQRCGATETTARKIIEQCIIIGIIIVSYLLILNYWYNDSWSTLVTTSDGNHQFIY